MSIREFLRDNWRDLLQHVNEHIALVVVAMAVAIALGIPLGILISRRPALQRPVLGVANIFQTVPSLAMFGFLLPLLGLGAPNAIVALILYSLLPLIRNTVTGIAGVDGHVREAAVAMGMTDRQVLFQVELPLASSVILAGVRTATVLCVGVATIASFIAAGGLGEYIQNGLRANDNVVTMAGAVPAALLALCADAVLGALQTDLEARNSGRVARAPRAALWRRLRLAPAVALLALGLVGAVCGMRSLGGGRSTDAGATTFVVGSKDFTESRLLAEIVAQMAQAHGLEVVRKTGLGGNLCQTALLAGQIDCYPEYTGTAYTELLHHKPITDVDLVYKRVKAEYAKRFAVTETAPLGFSNGFAMLVRGADARRLHLATLSDAVPYTGNWVAGFGPDFISRADGYSGLVRAYGLHFASAPRSMDLSLINRALAAGKVDLIAGNETDGLIPTLDLYELRDDRHYFPPYQGVFLVRQAALTRLPALRAIFKQLAGAIDTAQMQQLNYEVDGKKRDVATVAAQWRKQRGL